MAETNQIALSGGDIYITHHHSDAFRVKSGTLLVYIIPYRNNDPGRKSFIYEAQKGEVIPGFAYKDMDYCNWRFCFSALETAEIDLIEEGSTKVLREKFAKKAGIKNYQQEGFEESLVDQYRINIVTEDGFIKRSQRDRKTVSEAINEQIRNAFKKETISRNLDSSGNMLYDCAALMCMYQKINIADYEKVKETYGPKCSIANIAGLSHFAYREVVLPDNWYQTDSGAFLVFDSHKNPMVCLPKGRRSYTLFNPQDRSLTPVSAKVANTLSRKAFMLYRPLPAGQVTKKNLISYCAKSIRPADVLLLLVLTIVSSLIGLLTPTISGKLYDEYIPLGASAVLFQLGCVMASFMIANILFSIVKNMVSFRISSRMSYDMQSAMYDRLFNLPESFFRKYESADLAQRVMSTGSVVNTVATVILSGCVSVVFMLIYFIRMLSYSVTMSLIGLLMVAVYAVLYYFLNILAIKYRRRITEMDGKTTSIIYQLLNGIAKIRIAGVEDRAVYEYIKPYIRQRNDEQKHHNILTLGSILTLASNSLFSMILYIIIIKGNTAISIGSFIAFSSMFGSFTAYAIGIVEQICQFNSIKPEIQRLKPILDALPELNDAKELPGDISGAIEINNVTFAYSEDSPNVLNNLNLNIRSGEYIGIVGSSGCGKSTLLKLLLGFEKPNSGKIYYDNKDIESVDIRELRKKMGVVLQDGKLISGSIFENITITCPGATMKDVEKVIKDVGLEKDIKEMPMGLHTVLSEDCGTISGGQQQRILIARAVVSQPRILIFDEATSALDNLTQKMVCDTIEKMHTTRIVIAHRLSTIMNCDRIIVMDKGKIAEQGSYEDLMKMGGLFYRLASRQIS